MPDILFVEDDATIATGVEYALKQDGFHVSLTYRLEQARDLLKRRPFDLVLLDLGLPDGSGYELCKEIRAAGDTLISPRSPSSTIRIFSSALYFLRVLRLISRMASSADTFFPHRILLV
jgi:CheY-like chemotaxis protein